MVIIRTLIILFIVLIPFAFAQGETESTYIVFTNSTNTYAQNGHTGNIDFKGNSSYVIQSSLNNLQQGQVIIKQGQYMITKSITIPTTALTITGENPGGTILKTNQQIQSVFLKSSGANKLIISNLGIDCNSVTNYGLNLTDSVESSYNLRIQNMRIQGCLQYGMILNGNEDSKVDGVIIDNIPTNAKALQWTVQGGNTWITNSLFGGDIEMDSQQSDIRDSTISGVKSLSHGISKLILDGDYFNGALLNGRAIDGGNTGIEDVIVENSYFALKNNQNVFGGNFTDTIFFLNNFVNAGPGTTVTVFPSKGTLDSHFGWAGAYPTVNIIGGDTGGGGTINLVPANWIPSVVFENLDDWNRGEFGNVNLNEASPVGLSKIINLKYPYPDNYYLVSVENQGNGYTWITNKTPTQFTINYSVNNGFPVSWKAIHQGM